MSEKNKKNGSPGNNLQTRPEFEKFRSFAKRIVNVPKKEIDEQAEKLKASKNKIASEKGSV
jgi:hypothetical protein